MYNECHNCWTTMRILYSRLNHHGFILLQLENLISSTAQVFTSTTILDLTNASESRITVSVHFLKSW